MKKRSVLLCILIMFTAPATFAQGESVEEAKSPWAGKVSLGYLATSGNTENSNLNGNFVVGYTAGKWVHTLDAYAINASESQQTTAEAYGAGWKSEWNLSERNFLFGLLNYRKDRFSGFPTQFSESVGYGRRIIDTPVHMLNAEIGAGARQSERADGINESDFIVRGGLNYKWTFSETANFTQDFMIEYGDLNTYSQSITALRARILGNLAMAASYTIKNNSDVPPLTEKTDTFTAFSLEYSF